jgi:hypothetical protein
MSDTLMPRYLTRLLLNVAVTANLLHSQSSFKKWWRTTRGLEHAVPALPRGVCGQRRRIATRRPARVGARNGYGVGTYPALGLPCNARPLHSDRAAAKPGTTFDGDGRRHLGQCDLRIVLRLHNLRHLVR